MDLDVLSVTDRKNKPTVDSDIVRFQGKNGNLGAYVKSYNVYVEEGDDQEKNVKAALDKMAGHYETFTTPFKAGGPSIKARAGKVKGLDSPKHIDTILKNTDIADVVTILYPDAIAEGHFNDDESSEGILSQYFSLTPFDEAKVLVLDAYEMMDTVTSASPSD